MAEPALALERLRSALPQHPFAAHLQSARELLRARERVHREAPFPTSLAALDRLLGGGLERGALTELLGDRSSGRFSTVVAILAAATAAGEAAALVDLGGHFDPQFAADAGCALERLLWARPAKLREALHAAEMVLGAGFPLVVLDLGTPPIPGGRGVEGAWLRLARAAQAPRSALLVAAPYRVSGSAAHAVVAAHHGRATWRSHARDDRDSRHGDHSTIEGIEMLTGIESSWTLERSRTPGAPLRPPVERCRFRIPSPLSDRLDQLDPFAASNPTTLSTESMRSARSARRLAPRR